MSIQAIAIASALVLSGGSALAAEKVGRTIEAQETVSGGARSASGIRGQTQSIETSVYAPI